jgi:diaminohydroxyphosphoribosylaminopyrimidine deaminase/5-amino-6-(5-phosphoribosylamino)uracil reductase
MIADDVKWMGEALALAQRAAGRTSPNPLVGALVVAGGEAVGRGFHPRAGEAHAEVLALRDAGERARGSTVYTTLEPCNHTRRTGPCTDALLAAGVRRVVVAMIDPDAQVSGQGIARLRQAGLAVDVGILEDAARRVNEFYIKHRTTGLPFVTLKWAMSLDGKIGVARSTETSITGEDARRYAHELRNVYDAVLVGVGTVLADDPELTCRLPGGRDPLRIIVDSTLRAPSGARIFNGARTLVVTTNAADPTRAEKLREAGVDVIVQAGVSRVALRPLFEELGRRGVLSVLIEGGGTVNASALADGLVDKVIALVAPRLIGGEQAPTPVDGVGLPGGAALRDLRVWSLGADVAIEGYVGG